MASQIPARITAGDSLQINLSASDYPPPAWSVAMSLTPATGGAPQSFAAAWSGLAWEVDLTATASAALSPGAYRLSVLATDPATDRRATLHSAMLEVCPDPASGADPRSEAQKHLDAIDATLADPSWIGAESYTIEGRSLARRSLADLQRLRAFYVSKVRAERGQSPFVHMTPRLAR